MSLPDTPEGIVEELRREALEWGLDLDLPEGEIDGGVFTQAADLIELYERALRRIANGEAPAREIARQALDWLARFSRGGS